MPKPGRSEGKGGKEGKESERKNEGKEGTEEKRTEEYELEEAASNETSRRMKKIITSEEECDDEGVEGSVRCTVSDEKAHG